MSGKGASFKVVDDPIIDTTSRTGKLEMGILALIAEFENDIRRERQMDEIARDRGVRFGRKPILVSEKIKEVRKLRKSGTTASSSLQFTVGEIKPDRRSSATNEAAASITNGPMSWASQLKPLDEIKPVIFSCGDRLISNPNDIDAILLKRPIYVGNWKEGDHLALFEVEGPGLEKLAQLKVASARDQHAIHGGKYVALIGYPVARIGPYPVPQALSGR